MGKNTIYGRKAIPTACALAAGALMLASSAAAQPAPAGGAPAPSTQPPPAQPAPMPAAQPAPAAAPAPGGGQPARAQSNQGYGLVAAHAGAAPERQGLPPFSAVVHAGLLLGGSGSLKYTCNGSYCSSMPSETTDYSHKVAFALGADFLWRLGSIVRLGPGVMFVPGQSVTLESNKVLEPNNTHEPGIGSDMAIDAVLEIVPQVSDTVWLAPRLQAGLGVFFPGSDLGDYLDSTKQGCNTTQFDGCDSINSTDIGWHAGLGFGVIFAVSDLVRLRADVLAQYYSFNLYTVKAKTVDFKASEDVSSSRGFLLLGVEF